MPTTLPPSRTLAVLFEVESRGRLWELDYTSFGLSAWAHLRWLIALRLGDALYGSNLQEGVAGFGDSPADAMWDFDRNWSTKIAAKVGGVCLDAMMDRANWPSALAG